MPNFTNSLDNTYTIQIFDSITKIGSEKWNAIRQPVLFYQSYDFLETIELAESKEMNFTGKPMKGFVYITEQGTQSNKALEKWLQLCLNFNPLAKKSKKK